MQVNQSTDRRTCAHNTERFFFCFFSHAAQQISDPGIQFQSLSRALRIRHKYYEARFSRPVIFFFFFCLSFQICGFSFGERQNGCNYTVAVGSDGIFQFAPCGITPALSSSPWGARECTLVAVRLRRGSAAGSLDHSSQGGNRQN